MEEEYFVDEKIDGGSGRGKYVPVSCKMYKRGETGFVNDSFPWQRVHSDKVIPRGTPVFIISYIQHSSKDEDAKCFLRENDAKRFISALGKAISRKYGCDQAKLHYNLGTENITNILKQLPPNTFVNFRTPTEEFSVTYLKTVY